MVRNIEVLKTILENVDEEDNGNFLIKYIIQNTIIQDSKYVKVIFKNNI